MIQFTFVFELVLSLRADFFSFGTFVLGGAIFIWSVYILSSRDIHPGGACPAGNVLGVFCVPGQHLRTLDNNIGNGIFPKGYVLGYNMVLLYLQ